MKLLLTALLFFLCSTILAQNAIFVRVYDMSEKKTHKGHIKSISDSTLQLEENGLYVYIPFTEIKTIKTNHSGGHTILMTTLIYLSTSVIISTIGNNPNNKILSWSSGEAAAIGAILAIPSGVLTGGIIALLKKNKTYTIDGEYKKWKIFQSVMQGERYLENTH